METDKYFRAASDTRRLDAKAQGRATKPNRRETRDAAVVAELYASPATQRLSPHRVELSPHRANLVTQGSPQRARPRSIAAGCVRAYARRPAPEPNAQKTPRHPAWKKQRNHQGPGRSGPRNYALTKTLYARTICLLVVRMWSSDRSALTARLLPYLVLPPEARQHRVGNCNDTRVVRPSSAPLGARS